MTIAILLKGRIRQLLSIYLFVTSAIIKVIVFVYPHKRYSSDFDGIFQGDQHKMV